MGLVLVVGGLFWPHAVDAAPILGLSNSASTPIVQATFRGAQLTWSMQYKCTSLTEACENARIVSELSPGLSLIAGDLDNNLGTVSAGTTAEFTIVARTTCLSSEAMFSNKATFTATGAVTVTKTATVTVRAAATCEAPTPPDFVKVGPANYNAGGRPRFGMNLPARTGVYVVEDPTPPNLIFDEAHAAAPVVVETFCGGNWQPNGSCVPSTVTNLRFTVPPISDPGWAANPERNYSWAGTAYLVPDSLPVGTTISNTATIVSGTDAGLSSTSSGPTVAVAPMPAITKTVERVPGTRVSPSFRKFGTSTASDAIYSLRIENDDNNGASGSDMVNPVVTDLLDIHTEWIDGSTWWKAVNSYNNCPAPTFTAIPNFNGTGRTLLRWAFNCSIPHADVDEPWITVYFTARVIRGTPEQSVITNDAAVSLNGGTPFTTCGANVGPDVDDLDGDGNRTELRCACEASFILPKLAVFESSKWVNGAADARTAWSRFPAVGQTTVGAKGSSRYQLLLSSVANVDAQVLEIFDILPFVGDTAVSEPGLDRESEWSQQLTGPVIVDFLSHVDYVKEIPLQEQTGFVRVDPSRYVVEYSASTNPCRLNPDDQLKFDGDLPTGCVDDWGPEFGGARAFRVRLDQTISGFVADAGNGDTIRLSFSAVGAGDVSAAVDKTAWNSFGYTATDVVGFEALTAEPIKVGIRMTGLATPQASLGDYVWYDENGDGVQQPEEEGVAGVTLSLLDNTKAIIQRTKTDADGKYQFLQLSPETPYSIQLDRPEDFAPGGPLYQYGLTLQDAPKGSNDDTLDSDGAMVSNRPAIAVATTGGPGSDTPTYDFGFVKQTGYSLGNRVWFDDNNSGSQDATEAGVDNVIVNLLVKQGNGTFTPLATDTTETNGYYRFDGLEPGEYRVVVDPSNWAPGHPLAGRRSSTGPLANNDPNSDIDRDDNGPQPKGEDDSDKEGVTLASLPSAASSAAVPAFAPSSDALYAKVGVTSGVATLSASEPTNETDLSPSGQGALDVQANMTIDFGFVTPKFAVGNYVWMDTDGDGIQDPTERGVNGVAVSLYDSNQTSIKTTRTADGPDGLPGYYLFDDLLAGTYSAGFTLLPPFHVFTSKDMPDSDALDSDADRTTGRTGNFVLDETLPVVAPSDGTGLRAGYVLRTVDAGIHPVFSLGDNVWHDLNANGTKDANEPGIAGARVELYAAGSDGQPTGAALAADVTNSDGSYLFSSFSPGDYVVVIPATQFAPTGPLATFFSSGTTGAGETPAPLAESGIDADDNGTKVLTGTFAGSVVSSKVTLGPTADEPTAEPATPGREDSTPDSQSNLTVDFGFINLSVGNLVWNDQNNNGIRDGAEAGLPGVTVRIYRDDNADGVVDGPYVAQTLTNANGQYLFAGLAPAKYILEVWGPAGYYSSTGAPSGYTGPFEPGKGDDFGADSADHGTTFNNVVRSATITLSPGTEPLAAVEIDGLDPTLANTSADSSTDLTLDFGLTPGASIGNYVWLDTNRNGVQDDAADTGLNAVTVRLLGPDGTVVRTTVTTTGPDGVAGYYRFDVLPGDYRVAFDLATLPEGFVVSPLDRGGNDARDSDADPTTGRAALTTLVGGEYDPDWDLGVYPKGVSVGNQVWHDINIDGLNNDGPTSGVPGVLVTLLDANGRAVTRDALGQRIVPAVTDEGGFYRFDNLAAGTYSVKFEPADEYVPTRSNVGTDDSIDSDGLIAKSRALRGGESDLTLDLGLVRSVTIGDRVFVDVESNGVQDPNDYGLPGVELCLYDMVGSRIKVDAKGQPVIAQLTGSDGAYLFKNLLPGQYVVRVCTEPPGFVPTIAGQGTRATDSSTGSETSLALLGGGEDRTLDFGYVVVSPLPPRSVVALAPAASPAAALADPPRAAPRPIAEVEGFTPVTAASPSPVAPVGQPTAALAFTGSNDASMVQTALMLLGVGLALSAGVRLRAQPTRRKR